MIATKELTLIHFIDEGRMEFQTLEGETILSIHELSLWLGYRPIRTKTQFTYRPEKKKEIEINLNDLGDLI